MTAARSAPQPVSRRRRLLFTLLIVAALAGFSALFVWVDQTYYRFIDARFPNVGSSTWLATLWGVLSRGHLIVLCLPLVLWRPRQLGFQWGKIGRHWRMLLIMLLANCGVVAGYLLLTGSTPYSGNQWLVTETVTVPLVEEVLWRGLVFAGLLAALRRLYGENTSGHWAAWLSGLAFGVLHAANGLAGVPILFVAIQTLKAAVWGVVYGYARAKTGSVYPSILLHAAMNLVVILF